MYGGGGDWEEKEEKSELEEMDSIGGRTKPGFCGDGSGNRPHIKVENMRIKNS